MRIVLPSQPSSEQEPIHTPIPVSLLLCVRYLIIGILYVDARARSLECVSCSAYLKWE